ncbi:MAG: hypothetical protein JWN25_44 [Verrucomicrobiales bacterium]|nr:hypothetical protein [Verrucomicrobiales bacterium]
MPLKKSWREKLAADKGLPKVAVISEKMSKRWGAGTMLIPAPRQVDALMKEIPKGKLITINEIRNRLAHQHGANVGCPITTGIFAWIAAHAAAEGSAAGEKKTTPYWRTLKSTGELNQKYPGGIESLKALLHAEGHRVIQKGKRFLVADYEKYLYAWNQKLNTKTHGK